jgi:hypothetical protein
MSIGNSGRVVIEVDPSFKRELYSALARDGRTLKDWFVRSAGQYIEGLSQLRLPIDTPTEEGRGSACPSAKSGDGVPIATDTIDTTRAN